MVAVHKTWHLRTRDEVQLMLQIAHPALRCLHGPFGEAMPGWWAPCGSPPGPLPLAEGRHSEHTSLSRKEADKSQFASRGGTRAQDRKDYAQAPRKRGKQKRFLYVSEDDYRF